MKKNKKFSKIETEKLLREVILGYSRGESVRSVCLRVADGSKSKMLRYQNKYRSLLTRKSPLIEQTVKTLEGMGYIVKSPMGGMAGKDLSKIDNILTMPVQDYHELNDQDIQNLFMVVVRLVRKQGQSQIQKLKDELAKLKIQAKVTK